MSPHQVLCPGSSGTAQLIFPGVGMLSLPPLGHCDPHPSVPWEAVIAVTPFPSEAGNAICAFLVRLGMPSPCSPGAWRSHPSPFQLLLPVLRPLLLIFPVSRSREHWLEALGCAPTIPSHEGGSGPGLPHQSVPHRSRWFPDNEPPGSCAPLLPVGLSQVEVFGVGCCSLPWHCCPWG